ncbi:19475_t:CDS:2 [Dentiscutata erythropus]|uniref:19475_t:CDS:1 n=1 Tax=Dentiscutata erythropus TaxID=1348616 RepID=A0A9N9EFS4_9GLOM|nr:19475_t:CDS:2 [Dentiscutata erythropus]
MSRHRLSKFNKFETQQFCLRAPKISKNLSSNQEDKSINEDSNIDYDEFNYDNWSNNELNWNNMQFENESYDIDLKKECALQAQQEWFLVEELNSYIIEPFSLI